MTGNRRRRFWQRIMFKSSKPAFLPSPALMQDGISFLSGTRTSPASHHLDCSDQKPGSRGSRTHTRWPARRFTFIHSFRPAVRRKSTARSWCMRDTTSFARHWEPGSLGVWAGAECGEWAREVTGYERASCEFADRGDETGRVVATTIAPSRRHYSATRESLTNVSVCASYTHLIVEAAESCSMDRGSPQASRTCAVLMPAATL